MKRLTGMDATFLYLETPQSHMHVASTIVADPSTAPGGWSFERARAMVENRIHLQQPWRRRLVMVPFGLHHPLWMEDPDFDLDYHVRRAALPAPGGMKELAAFAEEVMGRPLDRSKPLWEMYIVEGLEDGLVAYVSKTHHAAIDGVSGAELTVNLLDLTPETVVYPPEDPAWVPDRQPSDAELLSYAASSLARQPLAAVKAARRTAEFALNLRKHNRQPGVKPPPAPFAAPKTSINAGITPHRRFAMASIELDDVKRIKNALGGTVNDVVMALCAGTLRTWFDAHDEHPEKDLVALVPVSVRGDDQAGTNGNQVSGMLVSLATTVDGAAARLAAITEATTAAKDQERAIPAATLTNWAEFAAPAVAARAARLLSNLQSGDRLNPIFNVTVSNVPGPNIPLYSAGALVKAIYPMGPISDGIGLNVTVMSYRGQICFGFVGCRETVPDIESMSTYVHEALDDLKKAADEVAPPTPAAAVKKAPGRRPKGSAAGHGATTTAAAGAAAGSAP